MEVPSVLLALPVALGAIGFVVGLHEWRVARNGKMRALAESAAKDAELIFLQGAWKEARDLVEKAAKFVARDRDPSSWALWARVQLVIGECESALGHEPQAREAFAGAARAIDHVPADAARLLSRWHMLATAGLRAGAEAPPAELASPGESARAWEAKEIPHTLRIRLSRYAAWRAQEDARRGRWDLARGWLEWSVTVAEAVPTPSESGPNFGITLGLEKLVWALARAQGSASADELGQVLWSLGQHEEATRWLDRGVAALEAADAPPGSIALARALIIRAAYEPPDPLTGASRREKFLSRALDVVADCDWATARVTAARAELHLAALRTERGADGEAVALLHSAHHRVEDLKVGGTEVAVEALLTLAHLLEERGELDEARSEYRRAYEAGRSDDDQDARRGAVVAGCHLHRLLHQADRPDEARALLAPLDAVVPTLAPRGRPLFAALVARSRGHQQFRDGDRDAADGTLRGGEALAGQVGGPEAADLVRQLAAERGNLAMAEDRPGDAEAHFLRALAAPRGARPERLETGERAEIELRLAQTRLRLGRESEALAGLRSAFEHGRGTGRAQGRSVAAVAALQLADSLDSPIEERRRLYEAASRLGLLSGTERGGQVAAAVVERLRELTE